MNGSNEEKVFTQGGWGQESIKKNWNQFGLVVKTPLSGLGRRQGLATSKNVAKKI